MASEKELIEALAVQKMPIAASELARQVNSTVEAVSTQLKRIKGRGLIISSENGWSLTEDGRATLKPPPPSSSMMEQKAMPYDAFFAIGTQIGLKDDTVKLTTDMVFQGDYEDLKWVWEALGQQGLRNDVKSIWFNNWRVTVKKPVPPEIADEVFQTKIEADTEEGGAPRKRGREYIIVDDEPVRVGENLGDYSLQDAKDILAIKALKSRFSGIGQSGAGQPAGASEKVSDLLTALSPYLNKGSGSDVETLKELLADKLALQRQEILSHIPQPGQPSQPKSFMEQITGFVAALGSLKEAGPMLRSILGVPESSGNPTSSALPVQLTGPDGQPMTMDLGKVIDWQKFQGEERRANERQGELTKTLQVVRENVPDGIQAILKTVSEVKGGSGAKTTAPAQPQSFECADCKTQFSPPAGWADQPLKCPECGREYSKEELVG